MKHWLITASNNSAVFTGVFSTTRVFFAKKDIDEKINTLMGYTGSWNISFLLEITEEQFYIYNE